jgi:hypothetical protein
VTRFLARLVALFCLVRFAPIEVAAAAASFSTVEQESREAAVSDPVVRHRVAAREITRPRVADRHVLPPRARLFVTHCALLL